MARDPKSGHYDFGGVEVQDVIKAKLTPEQYEGWLLGNVIKYSLRCNFKGQKARDHEKIEFYAKWLGAECGSEVAEKVAIRKCDTCGYSPGVGVCTSPETCYNWRYWIEKPAVAENVVEPEVEKICDTCASATAYYGCSEPEACRSHDKWKPKTEGGKATD